MADLVEKIRSARIHGTGNNVLRLTVAQAIRQQLPIRSTGNGIARIEEMDVVYFEFKRWK